MSTADQYREQGRKARSSLKSLAACPYGSGEARDWWLEGWRAEDAARGGSVPVAGELNAEHEVRLFRK